MTSKDDILNFLISQTANSKNTKEKYVVKPETVDKIIRKFKILRNCEIIMPNNIAVGQAIRYVDKELLKVSMVGIVTNIDYYSEINKSDIKTVFLYNSYTKRSWKINPEKYYIFQHRKIKLGDKIMNEIIDEYKKILENEK